MRGGGGAGHAAATTIARLAPTFSLYICLRWFAVDGSSLSTRATTSSTAGKCGAAAQVRAIQGDALRGGQGRDVHSARRLKRHVSPPQSRSPPEECGAEAAGKQQKFWNVR